MDMSPYRDLFLSEARKHLGAFSELIVQLEEDAADRAAIDELFRHAHSLKGMAATMQYTAVATLAHRMEDLLGRVRNNEFPFSAPIADLMLAAADMLSALVGCIETGTDEEPDPAGLIERLTTYSPDECREPEKSESPAATEVEPRKHNFRQSDSFRSVRVRTETLDRLVNIAGELITTRHRLADGARKKGCPELSEPLGQLSGLLRELRDEIFKARMLPFSFAAERFPRLVRDLARAQGKEISLQIEGREIELDRGILEEITEALVHILRNAVDHGMEPPDERIAAGKPAGGSIVISVVRDKDFVEISVLDDGRGMDPARLAQKAVEKGLLTPTQAYNISRQAALMLVCEPGFSTAPAVTEVSGRGVGMDAVRHSVHVLGGILAIDSDPGKGSRFVLRLPITVSIIHALMVECGRLHLAFPVNVVSRTLELKRSDIYDEDGRKVFALNGWSVPLKSLNRLLRQEIPRRPAGGLVPAVVSEAGGTTVGLITDRFLGQQEIFVKPLGPPLSRMKCLSGGTITGDGRIVFVMDAGYFA